MNTRERHHKKSKIVARRRGGRSRPALRSGSDQASARLRLGTRDAYRSGTITLLAMARLAVLILYQLAVVTVGIVPTPLSG